MLETWLGLTGLERGHGYPRPGRYAVSSRGPSCSIPKTRCLWCASGSRQARHRGLEPTPDVHAITPTPRLDGSRTARASRRPGDRDRLLLLTLSDFTPEMRTTPVKWLACLLSLTAAAADLSSSWCIICARTRRRCHRVRDLGSGDLHAFATQPICAERLPALPVSTAGTSLPSIYLELSPATRTRSIRVAADVQQQHCGPNSSAGTPW
jgi:hypothetical protein